MRNLWMYAFLKSHHNCDAYMDVQRELKSTFFTAFDHRKNCSNFFDKYGCFQ